MDTYNLTSKKIENTEFIRIYEQPLFSGFHTTSKKKKDLKSIVNRQRSNTRAKQNLKDLILLNFTDYFSFITLTFKENLTHIESANYIFKTFIRRLKYYLKSKFDINKIKYICIPEFQKRGAIHFHMLCDIPPFIPYKDLIHMWKKSIYKNKKIKLNKSDGSLYIKSSNKQKESPERIANYLTKYLTKQSSDTRFIGKKTYFCSRNLKRPHIQKTLISKTNSLEETISKVFELKRLNPENIKKMDSYINPYNQSRIIYIEKNTLK
ncbi:rolling circle replication-associated protein [Staphylococcus xylosus]|nr:hypothetical protein BUY22_13005 [Staphylococcus cohnii]